MSWAFGFLLPAWCLAMPDAPVGQTAGADTVVPIIDTHAHPTRGRWERTRPEAAELIAAMDRLHVAVTILSPPPFPAGREDPFGRAELAPMIRGHSDRLRFVDGGGGLNPLLQSTPADRVGPAEIRRFEKEASAIEQAGAAGFGELALEHFSNGRGRHPYESTPADHPLLFALADLAARYGMPIDIHMEAVPADMETPESVRHPPNPARLRENLSAFERLLDHNPNAKIVWLHAGWDLTRQRTPDLMRSLLARHPNLYCSVKVDSRGPQVTAPFTPTGELRPGWIALIRAFPNRFMIGSDQFFDDEMSRLEQARAFVDALPVDIRSLVAHENATHVYRLSR